MYTSLRWADRFFSPLYFFSFFLSSLARWSDSCYGMWCGTKGVGIQKLSDLLERSLSPSSLTLFVSQSVYSSVQSLFSLPVFLALDLSITYLFTLSGCCTLMWCWPRYSLLGLFLHSFCFLTHTYNMAIFYNNTHWCMHKITQTLNSSFCRQECVGISLWLPL